MQMNISPLITKLLIVWLSTLVVVAICVGFAIAKINANRMTKKLKNENAGLKRRLREAEQNVSIPPGRCSTAKELMPADLKKIRDKLSFVLFGLSAKIEHDQQFSHDEVSGLREILSEMSDGLSEIGKSYKGTTALPNGVGSGKEEP